MKEWGEIPAKALGRSGVSNKAAALAMGKSESWLSRALRGLEKLGWSDIGAIEDPAFWGELMQLMAEFHGIAFGHNEQARKDSEVGRRVREILELVR
jgi:DNA-binding Lrp family transcriptional regulator